MGHRVGGDKVADGPMGAVRQVLGAEGDYAGRHGTPPLHETIRHDLEPFEEDRIRVHEDAQSSTGNGHFDGRQQRLVPKLLDGDCVRADVQPGKLEAPFPVGERSPVRPGE